MKIIINYYAVKQYAGKYCLQPPLCVDSVQVPLKVDNSYDFDMMTHCVQGEPKDSYVR